MKRYARKSSGVHMRSVIIGPRRAVPPRSPDLNPVELFWSWLKRDLAKRDLQDLLARRAVLSKEDYRRRIQGILRGRRAQQVAAACTKSFRKACTLVVKNSGGAGK